MRIITEGEELEEIMYRISQAAEIAPNSNCTKSQRGAVIVKDGKLQSSGYIHHSNPEEYCNPCVRAHIHNNTQRGLCGAEHAEQMAMRLAIESGADIRGSRLYHIKVKDGEKAISGPPSCEICSGLILQYGIAEVVLWHDKGYALYNSREFDDLSRAHALKKKAPL